MSTSDNPHSLSQANALGKGFDIYGALDINSLMRPIFDFRKVPTHTFTFLGVDYSIPSIVEGIEQTQSYYNSGAALSRDELQNSLAVHAKVAASYGAFSGEMEAAFKTQYTRSSVYAFSHNTFYSQLAYLDLNPDEQYLSDDFLARINALPISVTLENLDVFEDFFNTFGIYFTSKITLGASLSFYVATQQASESHQQDIIANFGVQYNALYVKGEISADVLNSESWKYYSTNSQVNVWSFGADPTKGAALAKLTEAESFNPSMETVKAFNDWVDSIKTDPAIVDFGLTGIWEVCGARRKVVQQAWDMYGSTMRPRLVISTSTTYYPAQPYVVPSINIGRQILPSEPPQYGMGYQVVVLKGDISNPNSTIFNRYYSIDSRTWYSTFNELYKNMYTDLQPYQQDGNILILVAFNLNRNAPPSPDFLSLMRYAGAGSKVENWVANNDSGSALGFPANVILVGIFGRGTGSDVELSQVYFPARQDQVTQAYVEVFFYRRPSEQGYTLSLGAIG